MKPLPPKFSFIEALEFLGLPNDVSGHNQLLQHVKYDSLKMYVIFFGAAIRVDDASFKKPVMTSKRVIQELCSDLNETVCGFGFSGEMARAGEIEILGVVGAEKQSIEVRTFYVDGQEYYPLAQGYIADEKCEAAVLHRKQLQESKDKGSSGDDVVLLDGWWLDNEPLDHYVVPHKIAYRLITFEPDVQGGIFIREELLEFAKGFNEDDSKKNVSFTFEVLSLGCNEYGSKKREKKIQKRPKESKQQKREAVFETWIKEHGGAKEVKKMTRGNVWKALQEVDPKLFNANMDGFFRKQQLVAGFPVGRPKGS